MSAKRLTRGAALENLERQEKSALEVQHRLSLGREILAEIRALGGQVVILHEEIQIEFEPGTPIENQNRIIGLMTGMARPLDEEDTVPSRRLASLWEPGKKS